MCVVVYISLNIYIMSSKGAGLIPEVIVVLFDVHWPERPSAGTEPAHSWLRAGPDLAQQGSAASNSLVCVSRSES